MLGQQRLLPKITNRKYHIKSNWSHFRKSGLSNLLVVSTYSMVEFEVMNLVEVIKSLSSYRKNWVILIFKIDISGFVQEGWSIIRVIETWKDKMSSSFKIIFATTKWFEVVLKAAFEFVVT